MSSWRLHSLADRHINYEKASLAVNNMHQDPQNDKGDKSATIARRGFGLLMVRARIADDTVTFHPFRRKELLDIRFMMF